MAKTTIEPPKERTIRALFTKRGCPIGYHEVQTRLLGAIASPDPDAKHINVIASLWGAHCLSSIALTTSTSCSAR